MFGKLPSLLYRQVYALGILVKKAPQSNLKLFGGAWNRMPLENRWNYKHLWTLNGDMLIEWNISSNIKRHIYNWRKTIGCFLRLIYSLQLLLKNCRIQSAYNSKLARLTRRNFEFISEIRGKFQSLAQVETINLWDKPMRWKGFNDMTAHSTHMDTNEYVNFKRRGRESDVHLALLTPIVDLYVQGK